jgi:hypothetical protein
MTIERPMFPPRADNVVALFRSEPKRRPIARSYVSIPETEYAPYPRRYAKNPLRQHVTKLSKAIIAANKLDAFIDTDDMGQILEGAKAALILAEELGRLAAGLEG